MLQLELPVYAYLKDNSRGHKPAATTLRRWYGSPHQSPQPSRVSESTEKVTTADVYLPYTRAWRVLKRLLLDKDINILLLV